MFCKDVEANECIFNKDDAINPLYYNLYAWMKRHALIQFIVSAILRADMEQQNISSC